MKIRDAKGKTTEVPIEFKTYVTRSGLRTTYSTISRTKGIDLSVTLQLGNANEYFVVEGDFTVPDAQDMRILNGNQSMTPFVGSDFWLADLGLEFLHWPEQRMTRKEMRRSQFCKVIESINPQPATNAYSRVISWFQHEAGGIVYAEAYDAKGALLKIFEPKEIEKVHGQWQLREMQMRNVQTGSRTRIEFDLDAK